MKNLLIVLLFFPIFGLKCQNKKIIEDNFYRALESSGSTMPYFLLVNIQDEKYDVNDNICVTGEELLNALNAEWNINYEREYKTIRKIKRRGSRSFKFSKDCDRRNLYRNLYSNKELISFEKKMNIDSLIDVIKTNKRWSYFVVNEKSQRMLAHLLFKRDILTGTNECFGGMELTHIYWKD